MLYGAIFIEQQRLPAAALGAGLHTAHAAFNQCTGGLQYRGSGFRKIKVQKVNGKLKSSITLTPKGNQIILAKQLLKR